MYNTLGEEIPDGIIVLHVHHKTSSCVLPTKTQQEQKLLHAVALKKDRAEAFVQLANYAAQNFDSGVPLDTLLELRCRELFGDQTVPKMEGVRENFKGTIIFPTRKETYLYHLTGREAFIPIIEKAFWRKKSPACALLLLARLAIHKYNPIEIYTHDTTSSCGDPTGLT